MLGRARAQRGGENVAEHRLGERHPIGIAHGAAQTRLGEGEMLRGDKDCTHGVSL